MPTICTFYGILIQMFWQDHAPPRRISTRSMPSTRR